MNKFIKEIRLIWHRIEVYLFPNVCPACDTVTGSVIDGELCETCRNLFTDEYITECPVCRHSPENCTCVPDILGNDIDRSPFTTVFPLIFSGYYTGYEEESIISSLVYRMKRDYASGAGIFFARIIVQTVSRSLVLNNISTDGLLVTYIPRSESALDEHGFDHMEIVAKHTAEMLGCDFARLLIREGGTSQKKLSGTERESNAYNSIDIDPRKKDIIRSGKILLLDDIITTGSTMRAAVSRLSLSGAEVIIPAAAMLSRTKKEQYTNTP